MESFEGSDEEQFVAELPRSLRQKIANFLFRDLVASLPVLCKANVALLNALADCTEINMFSPNDEILKPGERIHGALLVSREPFQEIIKAQCDLLRIDQMKDIACTLNECC